MSEKYVIKIKIDVSVLSEFLISFLGLLQPYELKRFFFDNIVKRDFKYELFVFPRILAVVLNYTKRSGNSCTVMISNYTHTALPMDTYTILPEYKIVKMIRFQRP